MCTIRTNTVAAVAFIASCAAATAASLSAPAVAVGRSLETSAGISLSEPAPEGLTITIRSGDATRFVVSPSPDKKGTESLILTLRPGFRESPEFWIQGKGEPGAATYTAEAAGFGSATGDVAVTPSAIIITGPFGAQRFVTTTGAAPTRLTLISTRLDSNLQISEEQFIAGGLTVEANVLSSNEKAGKVSSQVALHGGSSTELVLFQPASEGDTDLSIDSSGKFDTPAKSAKLGLSVRMPGLAVSDQMAVGRDLQIAGVLSLGEAAPPDGVEVTLTSGDPSSMLLSASSSEVGSQSLKLKIEAGQASATYYLQALGGSGTVSYTAEARGFRSRTAVLGLTPSGIVLTPASQGPPDEAQVLRKEAPDGTHRFFTSMSHPVPVRLVAWTAQLDPVTHRAADITVQPLRAGLTLKIPLTNSAPDIAEVADSVIIEGGSDHGAIDFTPLNAGSASISVVTPESFTGPANSTSVIAVVEK